MNRFFSRAGLNWRRTPSRGITMVLNTAVVPESAANTLPEHYTLHVVTVGNVELDALWYQNGHDWIFEGTVFAGAAQHEHTKETAAALGRVGEGWFGYLGGATRVDGTVGVLFAMCGVV